MRARTSGSKMHSNQPPCYLSQDTDALNDVTKELKILVAKLSATIPKNSEGIYLRGSPKKKKRHTK